MIRWFAKNDLAANLLMIGILAAGVIVALTKVPLEVKPTREFPVIKITVPYRGGSPQEIERQIAIPIEQSLNGLSGTHYINTKCRPGYANIDVHFRDSVDPKEKLPEVERRVRSVRSFPSGTDTIRYTIPDTANYFEVISVVVQANNLALPLQELTEHAFDVKNALLSLPEVARASVVGTSPREFALRLRPEALLSYNLTFDKVLSAIQSNSKESGAGTLKYETGQLMIRPGRSALTGDDFSTIPIPVGGNETVPLGDLCDIHDGFSDDLKEIEFNGKPALLVEVFQNRDQSAITVADAVKSYVVQQNELSGDAPYTLHNWDDESYRISDRLKTLTESLLQGGLLVMVVLGLFLRPSLAFWVAVGIPLSFAGGVIFMPIFGITGNMMSIFGFILVLGIVVDDAIVTAENVYQHKKLGATGLEAAVNGTKEVSTPVIFGVLTTMVAFLPLYNFEGNWGVLAAQIPPVVIAVLLFSLIESKLILPGHLKHIEFQSSSKRWYNKLPDWFNDRLSVFIEKLVKPTVQLCMQYRYLTVTLFLALALACLGYWQSGRMGFHVFPAIDTNEIKCTFRLSDDAQYKDTKQHIRKVYLAAKQLQKEFRDGDSENAPSLVKGIITSSGGYISWRNSTNLGQAVIELMPQEQRTHNMVENSVLVSRLYELCGEFPDAESFSIKAQRSARKNSEDPDPIVIDIRGQITEDNESVIDELKELIKDVVSKEELHWVNDNKPRPLYELNIQLNEEGYRAGLSEASLSRQIKSSIIGTEVTRIPRPTGEIRVYLKFPDEIRQDRYALDNLLLTLKDGSVVPLTSVANVELSSSPVSIERLEGAPTTRIMAAPKRKDYDLVKFAGDITPEINKLFLNYPGLNWKFKGYLEDYKEMRKRFAIGISILLFVIFALLALPFNSAIQPLYVMLAIPFGLIGALLGHLIVDITPSYLSMFGILALSGIVVNDSLVLIDTYNKLKNGGMPIFEALITAVTKRFRPILLTSLTTFAGLMPLMFAKSMQAQFLVPMAVSLGFGILFATFVILLLLPAIVLIANDFKQGVSKVLRPQAKNPVPSN